MVNSMQHADEPGRSTRRELRIRGVRAGGCLIEVDDNGIGFDRASVPGERLGLRMSIEERMANAGGSAEIVSRPGQGTTVLLAWPAGAAGGAS
jgi:signal transduction histidine kinase